MLEDVPHATAHLTELERQSLEYYKHKRCYQMVETALDMGVSPIGMYKYRARVYAINRYSWPKWRPAANILADDAINSRFYKAVIYVHSRRTHEEIHRAAWAKYMVTSTLYPRQVREKPIRAASRIRRFHKRANCRFFLINRCSVDLEMALENADEFVFIDVPWDLDVMEKMVRMVWNPLNKHPKVRIRFMRCNETIDGKIMEFFFHALKRRFGGNT